MPEFLMFVFIYFIVLYLYILDLHPFLNHPFYFCLRKLSFSFPIILIKDAQCIILGI